MTHPTKSTDLDALWRDILWTGTQYIISNLQITDPIISSNPRDATQISRIGDHQKMNNSYSSNPCHANIQQNRDNRGLVPTTFQLRRNIWSTSKLLQSRLNFLNVWCICIQLHYHTTILHQAAAVRRPTIANLSPSSINLGRITVQSCDTASHFEGAKRMPTGTAALVDAPYTRRSPQGRQWNQSNSAFSHLLVLRSYLADFPKHFNYLSGNKWMMKEKTAHCFQRTW